MLESPQPIKKHYNSKKKDRQGTSFVCLFRLYHPLVTYSLSEFDFRESMMKRPESLMFVLRVAQELDDHLHLCPREDAVALLVALLLQGIP